MIFRKEFLQGIADGKVTLAFRRWRKPSVKAGGRLRTAIGELAIESVEVVDESVITENDARRAGFASRAELLAELSRVLSAGPLRGGRYASSKPAKVTQDGPRDLYRVSFKLAGPDTRVALREDTELSPDDLANIRKKLDRLDEASPVGPWTRKVLKMIRERPAVRAPDLAATMKRDVPSFKIDVRKLKNMGLTISLRVGYQLSPRGELTLKKLTTS